MLPVLLGCIYDRFAVAGRHGPADELLAVRVEVAPLGQQQIHYVQVLGGGLGQRALRGQEMNMRVATKVAFSIQVVLTAELECKLALARLDVDLRPKRLVLVTAG